MACCHSLDSVVACAVFDMTTCQLDCERKQQLLKNCRLRTLLFHGGSRYVRLVARILAPAGRFVAAHFHATKSFFGNMVIEATEQRLTCTFRRRCRCCDCYNLARIVPRALLTQTRLCYLGLQLSLLVRPSPQLKACSKPAGIIRTCPTCDMCDTSQRKILLHAHH